VVGAFFNEQALDDSTADQHRNLTKDPLIGAAAAQQKSDARRFLYTIAPFFNHFSSA